LADESKEMFREKVKLKKTFQKVGKNFKIGGKFEAGGEMHHGLRGDGRP